MNGINRRSLKFKVGLYLTVAFSLAVVLFTALVVWYQRNELIDQVAGQVGQLSQVIVQSTRLAMLRNQPTESEARSTNPREKPMTVYPFLRSR